MKKFLLFVFLLLITLSAYPEEKDSLLQVLKNTTSDTAKVNILFALVELEYDDEKWPAYNNEAFSICERLIADGKSVAFAKKGLADALNNKGYYLNRKGDIKQALEYYHQSLEIFEELNDKEGIAYCLNNLGYILKKQGELNKAAEYYTRSITIKRELKDFKGLSNTYNNLGHTFLSKKEPDKALPCFYEALNSSMQANDKFSIGNSYNNIGLVHFEKNNPSDALIYFLKAFDLRKKINDKQGVAFSLINLGKCYFAIKDINRACEYGLQAFEIAKELKIPENVGNAAQLLSQIFAQTKDFENAYEYQVIHKDMADSLFNLELKKGSLHKQYQYDWEKKEAVLNAQKESELELEREKSTKQKVISFFIIGFLAIAVFFVFLLLNRYKVINNQKQVIEDQKVILETKNKDILDSIHYAKRIQEALLKAEEHVTPHLPKHFVLFKPKDIVSGDFYWSVEKKGMSTEGKEEHLWYLAAVDCTGHGVPGALMSMLGVSFLNEINSNERILKPSEILDLLRERVVSNLSQASLNSTSKDGMDISLIRFNLENNELQWAGANNPLWIMKKINDYKQEEVAFETEAAVISASVRTKTTLVELKPDKQPIGYHPAPKAFTNYTLKLEKGDSFYLFTDGYADQFGGEKGKKFKYSRFKDLLLSINDQPMAQQKNLLLKNFSEWKRDQEQVDDVCIIGVQI